MQSTGSSRASLSAAKTRSPFLQRAGFSLIEVVVATFLIALVGGAISSAFLNLTRASLTNRVGKRAAGLADMVMERYIVYASSDFAHLEARSVPIDHPISAAAFFGTPDNMGYDNLSIASTVSIVPSNPNLKKIVLTITALNLGSKIFTFEKYFSAVNNVSGGATVDVHVFTKAGAPIAGAQVQAPLQDGTGTSVATTDASGYAFLQNVKVGANIPISVSAAGSDSAILIASPAFIQGYFVHLGPGNDSGQDVQPAKVQSKGLNSITFNKFEAASRISGTIVNETIPGTDPGFQIELGGNGSQRGQTVTGGDWVLTSQGGSYELNNLVPGTISINVMGVPGSAIGVQKSDPTFIQGYSGDPALNPTSKTLTYQSPMVALAGVKLYAQQEGAVLLKTKDTSGVSYPSVNVRFALPADAFRPGSTVTVTTDGLGQASLYNVVPSPQTISFYGFVMPSPPDGSCTAHPYGHYGTQNPSVSPGSTVNSVTLTLAEGHHLFGTAINQVTGAPFTNLTVTLIRLDQSTTMTTMTDGLTGDFSICGVAEDASNNVNLTFSSNLPVMETFPAGRVFAKEYFDGTPVVGSSLTVAVPGVCPGTPGAAVISDASGAFPTFCYKTTFQDRQSPSVAAQISSNDWPLGSINIQPDIADIQLQSVVPYFYDGMTPMTIYNNTTYGGSVISILQQLAFYPVTGTVKDSETSAALPGIPVQSGSITTATTGTGYYSLAGKIVGRASGGVPGTVTVVAGPGTDANTGFSYGSQDADLPVPSGPFNVSAALVKDFSLIRRGKGL